MSKKSRAKSAPPASKPFPSLPDGAHFLFDWLTVTDKLGHYPSDREYDAHGIYGSRAIKRRFGSWQQLPKAIGDFASANAKALRRAYPAYRRRRSKLSSTPRQYVQPLCGDLVDFDGMRNAPINEAGVVFLFGVLAGRLGFQVESLQAAFPDCLAKRRIRTGVWKTFRIEFEFESRNFRAHGHPADDCDIIVCWHHNWLDCPKNLEVIALEDEIKNLGRA